MQVLSLIWGLLAAVGLTLAFFPFLGALNWLNIPFALIGLVVGLIARRRSPPDRKGLATAGVTLCAVAVLLGAVRLYLGGGFI